MGRESWNEASQLHPQLLGLGLSLLGPEATSCFSASETGNAKNAGLLTSDVIENATSCGR